MTEEELVKKAQSGENKAFGELYDKYIVRIYRFVFIKVTSKHDAEDLTSQIFMSAWQNIRNFEFQGFPFSSWLYKIASNTVIDFYRTRKQTESIQFVAEETFAEFPEFSENIDQALELQIIKRGVQKLESDQQNVLIMKFVDELSNKEIAGALGKSEGAVRVIQHRALKQLKKYVESGPNQKVK